MCFPGEEMFAFEKYQKVISSKFQIICIPCFEIISSFNVLIFWQMKQRFPFLELTYDH